MGGIMAAQKEVIYFKLILDTETDISSATVLRIYYKKPVSGDSGFWVGILEGTDTMYYLTATDNIDEKGNWILQAYIEDGSFKGKSKAVIWRVYDDFEIR
jgi:hypothetical protein